MPVLLVLSTPLDVKTSETLNRFSTISKIETTRSRDLFFTITCSSRPISQETSSGSVLTTKIMQTEAYFSCVRYFSVLVGSVCFAGHVVLVCCEASGWLNTDDKEEWCFAIVWVSALTRFLMEIYTQRGAFTMKGF